MTVPLLLLSSAAHVLLPGETLCTFEGHHDMVLALALSADDTTLYSTSKDATIRMWDAQSGPRKNTMVWPCRTHV